MRHSYFLCGVGLLIAGGPAAAQFRYDDNHHRDYQAHWDANPDRPDRVIDAWHQRYFGGPATESWIATWMTSLQNGATLNDVLANMLATDEFFALSGGTPAGYVTTAFTRLVGRAPTQAEFSYWLNQVTYGARTDFTYALIARYPPAGMASAPNRPEAHEYRPPIWRYKR
jgi:hypothetical protein